MTLKKPPGWVATVLERRLRIEDALGMPIGKLLGCGHWGCVFESVDPWVVKLTRDPTEGNIWARLRGWLADTKYGVDGMVRVKEIVRLLPDVKFGRRAWPIHAVVRESIAPISDGMNRPSRATADRLGVRPAWLTERAYGNAAGAERDAAAEYSSFVAGNVREYFDTIDGLLRYRELAERYHAEFAKRRRSESRLDDLKAQLSNSTNRMSGPIGGAIGETLLSLLDEEIVLRDLHLGNIGWRVHEEIDGEELHRGLVIFDPGHTPTDPAEGIRILHPNFR